MKSKALFVIAIIGFLLSLIAHFCTFLSVNPMKQFPFIWVLHIGIFIVFIPAVFHLKKNKVNGIDTIFRGIQFAPVWMKVFCGIFFIYAFINFIIFMSLISKGSPNIIDGNYVLSDHGKIIEHINRQEYDKYQSYMVRGFSGHWMIFYFLSATIIYSMGQELYKNSKTST